MENKIYTVVITEQESDLIEQLQYETHVQLSILHYLLRQGGISDDIIENTTREWFLLLWNMK